MLETIHSREFYQQKAEEDSRIKGQIHGWYTFEHELDYSIANLIKKKSSYEDRDEAQKDIDRCIDSMCTVATDLDEEQIDKMHYAALVMSIGGSFKGFTAGSGTIGVVAGLTAINPVVGAGVALICAGLALGSTVFTLASSKGMAENWSFRRNLDEIYAPAYELAQIFDQDIGKCFLYDYFEEQRERFEKTYIALDEEDKTLVDQTLYEQLEFGAVDMAEHELMTYLAELKEDI